MIAEEDRGVDLADQETAPAITGRPFTARNLATRSAQQDRAACQAPDVTSERERESGLPRPGGERAGLRLL